MFANQAENSAQDEFNRLRLLSDRRIQDIHKATLEILADTGVKIQHGEIRRLLRNNDCWFEDEIVHIPPGLVEWAIRQAPSQVMLYNRNGKEPITLGGTEVTYGLGPTLLNMRDHKTGERRRFKKRDTEDAARLCDALPNIDWVMGLGTISDLPSEYSDRHEFDAMVRNTTKPLIVWNYTSDGVEDVIRMAAKIAGSRKGLKNKPFIATALTSLSPLTFTGDALAKLKTLAENGIPTINTPAPQAGASAPVTTAGQLVVANAENLAGLVISQLINEGLPFIIGGVYSIMDMKTATFSYGAPELSLSLAAYMDLARNYGIPTWGTGGCTDSKIVDKQAAIEASLSLITSTLSQANLVHDIGYLESGSTGSLEHIYLANEIIGEIKSFQKEASLETDNLVEELKPELNKSLAEISSSCNRDKESPSSFINDSVYHQNDDSIEDWARDRVDQILESHRPEKLEDKTKAELDAILNNLEDTGLNKE